MDVRTNSSCFSNASSPWPKLSVDHLLLRGTFPPPSLPSATSERTISRHKLWFNNSARKVKRQSKKCHAGQQPASEWCTTTPIFLSAARGTNAANRALEHARQLLPPPPPPNPKSRAIESLSVVEWLPHSNQKKSSPAAPTVAVCAAWRTKRFLIGCLSAHHSVLTHAACFEWSKARTLATWDPTSQQTERRTKQIITTRGEKQWIKTWIGNANTDCVAFGEGRSSRSGWISLDLVDFPHENNRGIW